MINEGREFSIIGWSPDRVALGSTQILTRLLQGLCELINMRSLGDIAFAVEPQLEKLGKEPFEDEGGASALLCLSTSHIAIHGWPYRDQSRTDGGLFRLAISSCRDFDPEVVLKYLNYSLHTTEVSVICNKLVELPA